MKRTKFKIITIVTGVVIIIAVTGYAALAFFTDFQQDSAGGTVGDVKVELHEDFYEEDQHGDNLDTTDANGIATDRKVFWGVSTGSKRSYVRARIDASFEWYNDTLTTPAWEPAAIPQSCLQYGVNAPRWIDGGDGYWYYSKVLHPSAPDNETTKFYVLDAKLTSDIPEFYRDKQIRYRMDVVLESAQATHDAYKEIFGINDLPFGVETL